MNSTIKDVATRAGVSTATVSRVINQNGYVSDQVRQKVLSVVDELGYSPSQMAVNLSKKHMRTIGVIVPDICNSFFSEVFYAASKLAEKHNYRVILCNTDDSIKLETAALQDMISYRVSGIIITPVSDKDGTNVDILNKMQSEGVPVVFVDREMRGVNCDGIFIDNIRGAYDATDLLLRAGHRKIAIIAGPQDTIPGRERMIGYMNAMNEWGIEPRQEYLAFGDFKTEKSFQVSMELINSNDPPTAFFTCNNLMTLGCLRAVLSCGKKIPDDIALVGFDKIDLLDVLGYNISMISRATSEMGTVAMRLLLNRIEKEDTATFQRVVLQSQLKSSGSERLMGS